MLKRSICILMILLFLSQGCLAQNIILSKVTADSPAYPGGALLIADETAVKEADPQQLISFFNTPSFDEYIAESILLPEELPQTITGLSQYGITRSEFADKYFDAVLKHPEALVATKYELSEVVKGTDIVEAITPVYVVDSKAAADAARKDMETALQEYTLLAEEYDTDVEKLLVIHDKMVADCTYDARVNDKNADETVPESSRHALGVLRDKLAVCQGYSQALYMIAQKLDIELDFCYAQAKNHMWNYVKLDGKWYHMDMTNDDPADADGLANHTFFLVSDGGLDEDVHGNVWRNFNGEEYVCSDTTYEADHLFNIVLPFTAKRAEDGYFHVPMDITDEGRGVSTEADFKSKSLYTGAVISQYCLFDNPDTEENERAFYFIGYSTRELSNTMLISRYNNKNALDISSGNNIAADSLFMAYIDSGMPENIPISFTAFLLDAVTLTPYAAKTHWTQLQ